MELSSMVQSALIFWGLSIVGVGVVLVATVLPADQHWKWSCLVRASTFFWTQSTEYLGQITKGAQFLLVCGLGNFIFYLYKGYAGLWYFSKEWYWLTWNQILTKPIYIYISGRRLSLCITFRLSRNCIHCHIEQWYFQFIGQRTQSQKWDLEWPIIGPYA